MTGEQKSFREKLGAVFFAFVMVTSVVAIGSAAFAGTAAAAPANQDGSGPSISTVEADNQGSTNKIYVTFDEPVFAGSDRTGSLVASDFTYSDNSGGDATSISSVTHNAGERVALLTMDATVASGDTGTDTLAAASNAIFDGSGNAAGTGTSTVSNNAVSVVDVEAEPNTNTATLIFSEGVGQEGAQTTGLSSTELSANGFSGSKTLTDPDISHTASTESLSGATATITLDENAGIAPTDIGSATIDIAASTDGVQDDDSSDTITSTNTQLSDNTEPFISSTATADTNNDGDTDQITVTMSEPIDDDESSTSSAFSLSSGSISSVGGVGGGDDATVILAVSGLSGTDPTPDVTLAANTLEDTQSGGVAAGNSQSFTSTSDGANPVIINFRGNVGSNTADVTFSEPVEDGGDTAVVAADFTFNDNSGDGVSSEISVSQSPTPGDTATITLNSDIISSDQNSDSIQPNAAGDIQDTSDNNIVVIASTLKSPGLSQGPVGGIEFEIVGNDGDDSTADVVAGSADEEIGEIRLRDDPADGTEAFAGTTEITFGSGVTINESASDLTSNSVITSDNGGVDIDSVNVVNNSNTIEIQHSGTSNAGETIRISSGAIHLNVDGQGFDTTSTSTTLDINVDTFSGTPTLSGALTAFSPTESGNNGVTLVAGSSNLASGSGYTDTNEEVTISAGDLDAAIEGSDTTLVGNQTNIVYSFEDSGVQFDAANTGSDLMKNSLDIDGDGTDEIDEAGISVSSNEISVPVVDAIDASGGEPSTAITLHNVVFATDGDAVNNGLNVTLEASAPSASPYVIDSSSGSATVSNYVSIASPDINVAHTGTVSELSAGQNTQYTTQSSNNLVTDQNAQIEVVDTTGGQFASGENITIQLNSSNVTFDTSLDSNVQTPGSNGNQINEDNNADPEFGINQNGGSNTQIGDATINEDTIEISITNQDSNNGDVIEVDNIGFNVSTDAPDEEPIEVAAVTKPSSASPDVVSRSTDPKEDGSSPTSNQIFTVQRTNIELPSSDANTEKDFDANTNSNITFDVDADGFTQQNPIGDSNTNALIINTNNIGQISDNTNVTIALEQGTGITFDKQASTATGVNNPGDSTVEVDVEDGDLSATNVVINDRTIDIVLSDNGGGGADSALDTGTGNEIVVDDFVINATGSASPTSISVTTNATVSDRDQSGIVAGTGTGTFTSTDNEVTTTLDVVLEPNQVDPSDVKVDPDRGDGTGFSNFAFNADQQVDSPQVTNTITSGVKVRDGGSSFGGADVNLEIVQTPNGSSGSSVNTTVVTTNQNGEAFFNFTAGDTIGDYVVNASIDGVSGGVNVTYTAQPGSIDAVTVSPIENAIASQGQGVSELGVAALFVNATDAQGNPVDASASVDITTNDVNANQIQVVNDKDPDGSSDSFTNTFGGSFSLDGGDGSSVVEIGNVDNPGDVTIEAELGGNTDTETVTFFDNVGQVGLSLNKTTAAVDDRVSAEATIAESDGTTIQVPDVPVTINDGSSGNTTFDAEADSVSVTSDSSGVATATITAEQTGSADITANTNLRQTTETLTIRASQADFQIELVDGPTSVTAGENYTVTVNVSNVGDASGEQAVDYALEAADGNRPFTDSKDVSLDADSSTEIEFNVSSSTTGSIATGDFTHVVSTAGADDATLNVTIQEAQQQEPSVSVTFGDQTVSNGTEEVTVDSANFTRADGSAGDYVVVVHTIDEFGAPVGQVSSPIGASGDLTGAEENITVNLTAADGPIDSITQNVTLRAMLHTTNDTSAFGTRLGAAIDGIERGDETDDANITVEEDAGDAPDLTPDERAANFDEAGNNNGVLDPRELINAISQFRNGNLTPSQLIDLITIFQDGGEIETQT